MKIQNTTIIELEKLGLNQNEINAICVLTHMDKNIKYQDYIKNLSKNSFAVIVKIADLEHNLQIERLEYKLTEKDYKRQ